MKKGLLLLLFMVLWVATFAQQYSVTGKVTSTEDGSSLPGVSISIKGTTLGTITDIDGNYSLKVGDQKVTLVFAFVGMRTQEIPLNGQSVINVALVTDVLGVDEVVVVGFGTMKKSLVTGSIAKVDAEDMENVNATRFEQALQGKVSGVVITQSSGSPGATPTIKIRGNSSYASNSPLYIIDGIKMGTGGGGMDFLNPNDIESIEVFKDAASCAIYGAEGGNGVIYITTKKGIKGTSQIEYNFGYSLHNSTNITPVMNAQQYRDYFVEATHLEKNKDSTRFLAIDPNAVGTVWTDEIFVTAPQKEHFLAFRGGSEKTTYLLSGSLNDQNGTIGGEKDNLKRMTLRMNLASDIKAWLKVGADVGYTHTNRNNLSNASNEYGGIINNALTYDPTIPAKYSDVSEIPSMFASDAALVRAWLKDDEGNYYSKSPITGGEAWNPLAQIDYLHNLHQQDKVVGKVYAEFSPVDWIKFSTSIGTEFTHQLQESFEGLNNYGVTPLTDDSLVNLNNSYDRWQRFDIQNFVTITKIFGEHFVEVMAGQSYDTYKHRWLSATGYMVPYNSIDYAYPSYVQNPERYGMSGAPHEQEVNASYFGRFMYNYKEKYMLQGNFRRDGSSRFGPDKKFGFFPSFSVGWNFSREDFFTNIDALSFIDIGKLRASWGQNGSKQGLSGYYPYVSTMKTDIYYQDASGSFFQGKIPGTPGNPALLWETSEQTDLGIDLGMFGNSFTFSADYYTKSTIDQQTTKADCPVYLGLQGDPIINKGEVKNWGWEFDLSYRKISGEFNYSASFNASYLKNEVILYGEEGSYRDGANVGQLGVINRYEPGYPVWYFYGYEAAGIFQTAEEVTEYKNENGAKLLPLAIPGDVIFKDQVVDSTGLTSGSITEDDRVYLGKPMPDWTFGLNLSCEYKGFDLNIFVQGQTGNQIYWAGYRKDRNYYNRPAYMYTDRWTGEGTSNTVPRATYNDKNNNFRVSSLNIYDGDYLRVKNVTIGYTLPKSITSRVAISKLRLYFTATNLLTFTKYPGMDPEVGQYDTGSNASYGIDRGLYPPSKVMTFGANVTF